MLGEKHSLICDFPSLAEKINLLVKNDDSFAKQTLDYDLLDTEIRELELKNSPIDDATMQTKKHLRAELKDALYCRLTSE